MLDRKHVLRGPGKHCKATARGTSEAGFKAKQNEYQIVCWNRHPDNKMPKSWNSPTYTPGRSTQRGNSVTITTSATPRGQTMAGDVVNRILART